MKIKNCPFCNSDEIRIGECRECGGHGSYDTLVFVKCEKCGGKVEKDDYYYGSKVKTVVIEAWNTRPTEAEIRAKVIEEFAEKIEESLSYEGRGEVVSLIAQMVAEIAEQLKGE